MYKKSLRNFTVATAKNLRKTQPSFNLVIRDHDQSAFGNGMNSTLDPRYFQIAYLWNTGNKVGENKIFGHFEAGGQEPGKTAMSGRNPGELYAKLNEVAPDTWLRSLSRGPYGNSVFPLHTNDLRKWYNFVNAHGNKKILYKVFDYNTNLKEMETALKIISEMGAPIEIAVPHSPDPQYMEFFAKKIEEAAKKAQQYGATISVKRMVAGLTEDEARRAAEIIIPIAQKYGIKDVTLHAHGDVSRSIAAFMATGVQLGLENVRGDIVHKGSGDKISPPTFPNFYETVDRLAQLGVKVDVSQEQLNIFKKIDEIQATRDARFAGIRTSGAFTTEDKVLLGMPDGGESYTVEAIIKAKLPEKLKITIGVTKDLFQAYYKEFRARFGMMVSVTPGHKRIEEGAITSMLNTLEVVKQLAEEKGVSVAELTQDDMRKKVRTLSYEQLYGNLNPKTIDAMRNDHLPLPLSKEAFEFICRTHMRNVLKHPTFKDLDEATVKKIIEAAPSAEKVEAIVDPLVKSGKLPKDCMRHHTEPYTPISLSQAAGLREYTENAGCLEIGPEMRAQLTKYQKQGSPIEETYKTMDDAECLGILTGNSAFISTASLRGSLPTPEGLTRKQFERELAIYYKYVNSIPGTLITERTEVLNAMEGLSWLYSSLEELEEVETAPTDKKDAKNIEAELEKQVLMHDREIGLHQSFASEKADVSTH